MPLFIIVQDAAFEVTVEFPLDVGYRLLTPRKTPTSFPAGALQFPATIEATAGPRVDRINRPIFITYISTVSA